MQADFKCRWDVCIANAVFQISTSRMAVTTKLGQYFASLEPMNSLWIDFSCMFTKFWSWVINLSHNDAPFKNDINSCQQVLHSPHLNKSGHYGVFTFTNVEGTDDVNVLGSLDFEINNISPCKQGLVSSNLDGIYPLRSY